MATIVKLDSKTDITAISAADFSNWTAAELSAMTKDQAGVLLPEQIATLTEKTVSGIFGKLSIIDPSLIAKLAINVIPLLPITRLTVDHIAALTPEQFKALTPAQVGVLSTVQLAVTNADQLGALTASSFLGLSVKKLSAESFSTLSVDKIALLSPAQLGSLTVVQLAGLTDAQAAALTPTQATAFKSLGLFSADIIPSLSVKFMAAVAPKALVGLTDAQVQAITVDQMNAAQIAAMPSATIAKFSSSQLLALTPVQLAVLGKTNIAGLAVASLDPSQLLAFKPSQFALLTTAQISTLPVDSVAVLTSSTLGALSSAQLGAIPAAAFAAIDPSAMVGITAKAIVGLTTSTTGHLANLTVEQAAALTPVQVKVMTAAQIGALPSADISAMTASAIQAISVAAIPSINPLAFVAFTPDQMAALKPAQFAALTSTAGVGGQIASLTVDQAVAITAAQAKVMTAGQAAVLSSAAVDVLTPATLKAITPTAFASLTSLAFASMSPEQIGQISAAQAASLTVDQLQKIGADQAVALTPLAVAKLTATQASNLTAAAVTALNPLAVKSLVLSGFDQTRMAALTADQTPNLTATQMASVTANTQLTGLTAEAIGAMNKAAFKAIPLTYYPGFTAAAAINAITAAQLAVLATNQVEALTPTQYTSLNSDVKYWVTTIKGYTVVAGTGVTQAIDTDGDITASGGGTANTFTVGKLATNLTGSAVVDTFKFIAKAGATVNGGGATDIITLGDYPNTLSINDADISITGGALVDAITFNTTALINVTVDGGTGADTIALGALGAAITIDDSTVAVTGGAGDDNVTFLNTLALADTLSFDGGIGTDSVVLPAFANLVTLIDVEKITGAASLKGSTFTIAGSSATALSVGAGMQTILSTNTALTTITDTPTTTALMLLGSGAITVAVGATVTKIDGSAATGVLTITGGAATVALIGGSNSDFIIGGGIAESITGGSGNDTLNGGLDFDTLIGGAGNDLFITSTGDFVVTGFDSLVGEFNGASADKIQVQNLTGAVTFMVREASGLDSSRLTVTTLNTLLNSANGSAQNRFAVANSRIAILTTTDNKTFVAVDNNGSGTFSVDDTLIDVTNSTRTSLSLETFISSGSVAFSMAAANNAPSFVNSFVNLLSTALNGPPVILSSAIQLSDAELSTTNYSGSRMTLVRSNGTNVQDVFSSSGALSFSGASGNFVLNGTTIGTFTNSSGALTIAFSASATQTLVNQALALISYSNTGNQLTSVQISGVFNDGSGQSNSLANVLITININTIPTLTTMSLLTGTKNIEKVITFANLQTAGNEVDADGTVTAFVVSNLTGTLKIGATSSTAIAWAAGTNDLIDTTHIAYWTPTANAVGKLNAFSVVAKDDSNTVSATAIPVQVVVGESYNGHIYLLSTSASWNNAEAQAIAMGGHLVTINSLAENSWVGSTFNVGNFWIGLTDKITEGTFVWASGEILSYTNWNAGEPNGENFVQMRSSPYYWNDAGSTGTDSNGTAMGIIELIGI